MANSQNGEMIDKEALYGAYNESRRWQQKLYRQTAHKALDEPCDDMAINVTKNTGIGAKGLMGVALVAGLPAIGLAGMMLWNQMREKPAEKKPVPASTSSKEVLDIGQPQVIEPGK